MSYSALYRRLRPKNFSDIFGQEHIVKTLKSQLISNRITHAYLFCGTRGTGKTSTARVFAKSVNCENLKDGEPCHICRACKAIDLGSSFNIIEVDAASNNSVDDIRELREEIKYPPAEGKYRVYIIDEVHMLSNSAFNALLKTLEEPPSGIIFILATTDPQKIPPTVHSRCQRFDFKRIAMPDMMAALEGYMKNEGIDYDKEAISYAARISDGAMRDALSVLDQCASFYMGEKVTLDRLLEITGSVNTEVFFDFANALLNNNAKKCIEIISELVINGRDILQFVSEFLSHLRNMLVVKISGGNTDNLLDYSQDKIAEIKEKSGAFSSDILFKYISVFSDLLGKLRYAVNLRILFEAACISMTIETEKPVVNDPSRHAEGSDICQKIISNWAIFPSYFGMPLSGFLANSKVVHKFEKTLSIICSDSAAYAIINSKKDDIIKKILEKYNALIEVSVIKNNDYDNNIVEKINDKIDFNITEL